MSLVPLGIAIAQAAALNLLSPIFLFSRNIGGFVADATLEETHHDDLQTTEHPVEQGASVTDHSFKRPATVAIRAAWSNSSLQALGDPNFGAAMYANFLELQASRQPFDVLTGKRQYQNMLMTRLGTSTTQATENALVLTVECRELILVQTQIVSVPNSAVMKNPGSNEAVDSVGTKNLTPAPNFSPSAAP